MAIEKKTGLWELFLCFAKVGVMTFGGGMAMLPLLQREIINTKGWSNEQELLDYFAVSQCTPGIIAINTATFIGFKQRGVLGGIVASLGMVFPSFVIIASLSSLLGLWMDNPIVVKAFKGIRIAVCALIFSSLFKLAKKAIVGPLTAIVFIVVATLQLAFSLSPIIIVVSLVLVGLAYHIVVQRRLGR